MIGRIKERDELIRMYESDESEFVAVYGRRRVGKTYLIREVFADKFAFRHSGLAQEGVTKQLAQFLKSLQDFGLEQRRRPKNWSEAFALLEQVVKSSEQVRKVVFIDEMPWMDTQKSGFLSALEAFWNDFCAYRKDVLLIVCGSAAAWMVKNLFANRGGLHNRVTCRIRLMPFTLGECERYAAEKGLALSRMELAEAYMALGGIPYYWRYLDKRYSLAQNFDRMFFADGAPLANEFRELYASLFKDATLHVAVIEALATKRTGMSQLELQSALGRTSSGKLTEILQTLEQSGFVRPYQPFGAKKKGTVFQLVDGFSLFHYRFLTGAAKGDGSFWMSTADSPQRAAWLGLSFELLCLQHVDQIKRRLGISGLHSGVCSWRHRADEVYPIGAQIDLLIDRADNVVNVCEMKYARGLYVLDKQTRDSLDNKIEALKAVTKTWKSIHLTLVTTNGLARTEHAQAVQSEVTLDDLFYLDEPKRKDIIDGK